ncbi:MAG: glycosyltransferase family 2 protein [Spirochaetia bacterium]|jgi:dolichol-phosphate mannosyltransferase
MKKIDAIIPCFNEEEVVETTYERLRGVFELLEDFEWRIIFIDDGSSDNTLKLLQEIASHERRVSVLSFSRNFGHEAATSAGLHNSYGDLIVILDADLQDPPELIPEMISVCQKEACDVVYGVRRHREGEKALRRFLAKLFYRALQVLSDQEIPVDAGDFRLITRDVVQAFCEFGEKARFVRGILAYAGFKQVPFLFDRKPRAGGKTKYSYRRLASLALDIVLSHSAKPLKIATHLGIWSVVASLLLIAYILAGRLIAPVPGWASIMATIVFYGGVQLFTIGILGRFLSTVLTETKNRPVYVIRKRINMPSLQRKRA